MLDKNNQYASYAWQAAVLYGHKEAFLYFAQRFPHVVLRDLQLSNSFGQGLCVMAVMDAGDFDTLKAVIELGFDVNQAADHTKTTWIPYVLLKISSTVCSLCSNPSEFHEFIGNNLGSTALGQAALFGNVLAVQVLLESRASVTMANIHGRTPLILAAMRGHVPVVELLLNAHAPVDTVDARGRSALGWAEKRVIHEVVAVLVDAGASRDSRAHAHVCCPRRLERQSKISNVGAAKVVRLPTILGRIKPSDKVRR